MKKNIIFLLFIFISISCSTNYIPQTYINDQLNEEIETFDLIKAEKLLIDNNYQTLLGDANKINEQKYLFDEYLFIDYKGTYKILGSLSFLTKDSFHNTSGGIFKFSDKSETIDLYNHLVKNDNWKLYLRNMQFIFMDDYMIMTDYPTEIISILALKNYYIAK
jgi:hypothetical protein